MRKFWIAFLILSVAVISCKKDVEEINPPTESDSTSVRANLEDVPYETLSEYRFFVEDMKDQVPNEGVLPYDPISHLFTDYALKKRFVWMPEGTKAQYLEDSLSLNFPLGAVIIKSFYYENVLPDMETRIIETRLLINTQSGWEFAEYVWNDDQTEAYLDLSGSYTDVAWVDEEGETRSTTYRIPAEPECFTCHKNWDVASPIGPKPQNLNKTMQYVDGSMNQLDKWVDYGYLEAGFPADINTVVNYEDVSEPLIERVRAYVDINCSHCHQNGSHCDYRPMRFAFSETDEIVNLGVCVEPDEFVATELTHIVTPGNTLRSMMYFRLNTTDEQYRMPLMGRTMIHEEGVALIEEWINSLEIECE